jgi:hypothetical protein
MLDQADNSTYAVEIPTRDTKDKVPSRFPSPNRPSMFWGNEHLWANPPYNPADPHNPMMDSKGRVWMTSKIRSNQEPAWCSDPAISTPSGFRGAIAPARRRFTILRPRNSA